MPIIEFEEKNCNSKQLPPTPPPPWLGDDTRSSQMARQSHPVIMGAGGEGGEDGGGGGRPLPAGSVSDVSHDVSDICRWRRSVAASMHCCVKLTGVLEVSWIMHEQADAVGHSSKTVARLAPRNTSQ